MPAYSIIHRKRRSEGKYRGISEGTYRPCLEKDILEVAKDDILGRKLQDAPMPIFHSTKKCFTIAPD
jgi:hypothetical protein